MFGSQRGLKDGVWKIPPQWQIKEESNPPSSNEKYIVKPYKHNRKTIHRTHRKREDTIHYKISPQRHSRCRTQKRRSKIFQKWTSFETYTTMTIKTLLHTINTKTKVHLKEDLKMEKKQVFGLNTTPMETKNMRKTISQENWWENQSTISQTEKSAKKLTTTKTES